MFAKSVLLGRARAPPGSTGFNSVLTLGCLRFTFRVFRVVLVNEHCWANFISLALLADDVDQITTGKLELVVLAELIELT